MLPPGATACGIARGCQTLGLGAVENGVGGWANLVGTRKVGELLLELGCLGAAATKQIVIASIESVTVFYSRKLVCIVTKDCLLSGKEVIGGRVN